MQDIAAGTQIAKVHLFLLIIQNQHFVLKCVYKRSVASNCVINMSKYTFLRHVVSWAQRRSAYGDKENIL
jgi:hypothetical protein